MGFLGLCDGDPVISTLRDVFGTNIIRVPEERYQPLTVLAADGDRSSFRGALAPLIKGQGPAFPPPNASQMPELTGKKTNSVNLDLGLKILAGFLQGMGGSSAGIDAKFGRSQQVSYTFGDVGRSWVDVNALGRVLVGEIIDSANPAASIFFGESPYVFLVLDSVITSSNFTISVTKTDDTDFKFDVPGIQTVIGATQAGISVTTSTGYDLKFAGSKHLAFAFSCVQFTLDDHGAIGSMLPDDHDRNVDFLAIRPHEAHATQHAPVRIILSRESGMIDVDDILTKSEKGRTPKAGTKGGR